MGPDPEGIGEHIEAVEFWLTEIVRHTERSVLIPILLPLLPRSRDDRILCSLVVSPLSVKKTKDSNIDPQGHKISARSGFATGSQYDETVLQTYLPRRLMDHVTCGTEFSQLRTKIPPPVAGEVLKLDWDGLNSWPTTAPPYRGCRPSIPSPCFPPGWRNGVQPYPFPVEITLQSAERLPMKTGHSTAWSAPGRSVRSPIRCALQEVRRVLKPEGIFFLEHGRSDDREDRCLAGPVEPDSECDRLRMQSESPD